MIIKNILVTDGNSRAALAITRSLGSKGYNIYVGDQEKSSLASNSKYCKEALVYHDPVGDHNKFSDSIRALIEEYKIDLVIPVTDVCVFTIVKMASNEALGCNVPFSDIDMMRLAADKSEVIRVADNLKVSVPDSHIVERLDEVDSLAVTIKYPIVIKPSRSRVLVDGKWKYTSVSYAYNENNLKEKLKETHPELYPIILQERINGPGVGGFYCYDHGNCVAKFSHRRIREKPPSGGVSVLRESVEIDPLVDKYSQELLSKLNWHGVAMVEYKYDEKNNIPYLMEINGRFWGSLQLAIDAGVDFPLYLVEIAEGSPLEKIEKYNLGVKTRWFWGDIDLLLLLLFKKKKELNLPVDYGPKWRVILSILNPFGLNTKYEILKLSDIKPWLFESKQWLTRIVNKLI